ncbi:MoxR-like ATPase [Bacillus sp. SLBN-46]|nr:MoxR-like ATPase [Bacillus sp. SLBN-46]
MVLIEKITELKREIGKVIVGKDTEVELMAISLLFNGHILLESVPGTGKTMLAKSFATAIGGGNFRAFNLPQMSFQVMLRGSSFLIQSCRNLNYDQDLLWPT